MTRAGGLAGPYYLQQRNTSPWMLQQQKGRLMDRHAPLPNLDQLLQAGRQALAAGNLKQAAAHVAGVLGVDPRRKNALGLLDQIIKTAGTSALQLAPVDGKEVDYATAAVRAYILAKRGQFTDALDLLLQVVLARPDLPYIDWAIALVKHPQSSGAIALGRVEWFLAKVVEQFPQLAREGRPTLDKLALFLQAVKGSQAYDGQFLFLGAAILRRLGEMERALEFAQEACEIDPGYNSVVAVANVYRDQGEVDEALKFYRRALRAQPEDVAVRLDMADMLWDVRRLDEAEALYREVLDRERQHAWALPSYYALRYDKEIDPKWKEKLDKYAASHPDNQRAQELAQRFSPYFGTYLPPPGDSLISIANDIAEFIIAEPKKAPKDGQVQAELPFLEAPSARLAFDLQMAALNNTTTFDCTVATIPKPDPRKPRTAVEYLLWKYKGTTPMPAVDPPSEQVAAAVGKIAVRDYDFDDWWQVAGQLAAKLGPDRVDQLLGVMVHPPLPPEGMPAWLWVQRIQFAAAYTIAQIDTGWNGSLRRKVLLDLANGPMDWTVDAAVVALTALALKNRAARPDVQQLIVGRMEDTPEEGYICYREALFHCAMKLSEAMERQG